MNLDLRHVRAITELQKHRSFKRAAEALNITPPALTKLIKELESDLGVEVVNRDEKPLTLTQYGQAIFEQGRNALQSISDSIEVIDTLKGITKREVAVVCNTFLSPAVAAPAALMTVSQDHEIHIHINSMDSAAIIEEFNSGKCDVLIQDSRYADEVLISHDIKIYPHPEIYYWVAKDHPLAGKQALITDVVQYPLVGGRAPGWWQEFFREYAGIASIEIPTGYKQTSDFHVLTSNDHYAVEVFMLRANAISGGIMEMDERFSRIEPIDLPPYPDDLGIMVCARKERRPEVDLYLACLAKAFGLLKPLTNS